MEKLTKIIKYLDQFLEVDKFEDKSFNGLQIEGRKEVKKIAFTVSAGAEIFSEILDEDPDLIVVHHGIFWKGANPSIKGWMKDRVKPLIENDVSLYACHLPLDGHKEVGNNAQILKELGGYPDREFACDAGVAIGWEGDLKGNIFEIKRRLEEFLDVDCKLLDFGPDQVSKVAVVSGSGGKSIYEAIDKDIDLLITGEETDIAELAKDAKINVIFGGHYATETTGIIALKKKIQENFNVETLFFDFPTDL